MLSQSETVEKTGGLLWEVGQCHQIMCICQLVLKCRPLPFLEDYDRSSVFLNDCISKIMPNSFLRKHPSQLCKTSKRLREDLQDLLELTPQKDVLCIIGDWNAKVGSQETPGVTDKFGLGVQKKQGKG